jgi:hypothetical protein
MMDCARLSDRMPEVALGRAQWTLEEAAHLADCSDCQQEWKLVSLASALGREVQVPDADAIASTVLRRVATERRRATDWRRWSAAGLAAAAAITLAVWYGNSPPGPNRTRPEGLPIAAAPAARPELAIPIPELDQLQEPELDSLLQTISPPLTGGSTLEEPSMSDLNDQELEEVLSTWEG